MSITIGYLQEYIRASDYRPELKEKYNVMSVPCLVINQNKVSF